MTMTAEAIRLIQTANGVNEASASTKAALDNKQPILVLPSEFKAQDIEKYLPSRYRLRGHFTTSNVDAFAAYVEEHKADGSTVFVDEENMNARAVLNLGSVNVPGHGDNTARFIPVKTAAYKALLQHTGSTITQKSAAEFLEDWRDLLQAFAGTEEIKLGHVITAVRKITIESASKSESEVQSLGASRSAFESVQASSSGNQLPELLYFKCQPYANFAERTFVMRFGVLTGERNPSISLRILQQEVHEEELAAELAANVVAAVNGSTPVLLGTYERGQ